MSYCTEQDMATRFGEDELIRLTDREHTGEVVAAVLERATADATATINGYLAAAGYGLPLAVVPAMLVLMACDIARYYLYDDAAPDPVRQRFDDAIKRLKDIAGGQLDLGLPRLAEGTGGGNAMGFGGRTDWQGGSF